MKFNCFFLLPFMDEFPAYLVSLFGLAVLGRVVVCLPGCVLYACAR
jgi:hypothetical protein